MSDTRIPIPKVPLAMRNDNKQSDDYDPKVVSFGPYHHGKPELNFVEDFKQNALEMFIQESDKNQDFFLEEILKKIDDFRRCYLEEFANKYNDYEFARMMLLDGCFILNDIEISTRSTPDSIEISTRSTPDSFEISTRSTPDSFYKWTNTIKHLGMAVYSITKRDLYLLENQVPFPVLKLLVKLRYGDEYYLSFEKNVKTYCFEMFFDKQENIQLKENAITSAHHLLEVFHEVLVNDSDEQSPTSSEDERSVFHSVMDLKSKGIHFRRSGINSLKGLRFTSHYYYADLKLPFWYVSTYTKVFFMNMIAYELCPNGPNETHIVSYINFMKSLVVSPNDVKELREAKIILNTLGSDEEVVQVYKELKTYEANDPSLFRNVKRNIEEHYNSKWKTWIAELFDKYFSSPWSLIALIVAALVTFLTVVQAYYASPFYHSDHEGALQVI